MKKPLYSKDPLSFFLFLTSFSSLFSTAKLGWENPSKTYKIIPSKKQNKPKNRNYVRETTFPLNYRNDHKIEL